MNGIYAGLGQSVGALIGGYLSKHWGIARAFSFCGIIDSVILSIFSAYVIKSWISNKKLGSNNTTLATSSETPKTK